MKKPWSDKLRQAVPYAPGEQTSDRDVIKLNANENPYPPSPKVVEAIRQFPAEKLCLYPRITASPLVETLAEYHGLKKEQVFVANSSDEVLAFCFQAFFHSQKPVFFPDLSYTFYPVWCDLFGVPYEQKPVGEDFRIRLSDYAPENGGVILPNPNAPTSLAEGPDFLRALLQENQDVVVIIDEAYVDFSPYSALELLDEFENLVVIRTFSKSRSLAGLRVGAAYGSEELIALLNAVKGSYNPFTLDSIALAAATASIQDEDYFRQCIEKVKATRTRSQAALEEMGFVVLPSQTIFLFVTHPDFSAEAIYHACNDHDIFIRYFKQPRLENYLRITIGTDAQMDHLFAFLHEYLQR